MPKSFHLPVVQSLAGPDRSHAKPVEALIPLAFSKDQLQDAMGDFNYIGLARLKPGVSVEQANGEINAPASFALRRPFFVTNSHSMGNSVQHAHSKGNGRFYLCAEKLKDPPGSHESAPQKVPGSCPESPRPVTLSLTLYP